MKLPLKLDTGKANDFGFLTGCIRDAEGQMVISGAFADRRTAQAIVQHLNSFCSQCGGVSWDVPLAEYCTCEKKEKPNRPSPGE